MNADQVLALAGAWQAALLAQQLAHGRETDAAAMTSSLESVFRIDAEDAPAVFGGVGGVRLGLKVLLAQNGGEAADVELTRMVVTMIQIERRLAAHPQMKAALGEGIRATERQRQHFDVLHAAVTGSLGELYEKTLSRLRPRIMVSGDPRLLGDAGRVARIRAVLLAGVRATVLWHQLGGRRWQLFLQRRPMELLARGMLSRLALEHG